MAVPKAHGADEVEGRQSRAFFAASALFFSFLVTLYICFLVPSFIVRLKRARSIAASSQLFGSISHALRSGLQASMNRRAAHPTFPTPVIDCPYKTFSGMCPSSMR